jgi:hypothetical protein
VAFARLSRHDSEGALVSEQALRPGSIALAAVVIGGVLILLLPQHAMSIARLVILTSAAAAGLHALGVSAPPTWWRSPFDRPGQRRQRRGEDDYDRVRSALGGWRQRIPGGVPLPPEVVRLLEPLIADSVARGGGHATGAGDDGVAFVRLSPLVRVQGVWAAARPRPHRLVRPDARAVSAAVLDVLNELDDQSGGPASVPPTDPRHT